MLATRWDPFRDLMDIQGELNRLFGRTYAGGDVSAPALTGGAWTPPLDVYEEKDKLVVTVELPGIEPEKVDVSVEDHTLTVRGEREFNTEIKEENFHRIERRYGSFTRAMTLPPTADSEHIKATFDKGVLTLEVPKREEAKPRRIEIEAGA